jgi:hypothetical protein
MKYFLHYQEQVYEEIEQAWRYYEAKQSGLGDKLIEAVLRAERDILLSPLGYQIKYENYRTRIASPFPYVLVYQVIEKEIIIYQFFLSVQDTAKRFRK